MSARLNLFQAMMLRWRDLHPYNAVHVVRVDAPLDAARLARAASAELEQRGLTGLYLDRQRRRYEWRGGAEERDVSVLAGGTDVRAVVRDEVERQLNTAFAPDGRINPFRFFAVDCGIAFHFGLAYDHFIAGGDSIVRLLGDIVLRYDNERGRMAGARHCPPTITYARLFARQAGPLARGLSSLPTLTARTRRSFRPRLDAVEDGRNAFTTFRMEASETAALVRAATEWGVTRNDLLIALLLKALSPLALGRRRESRRRELAITSIVNLRGDFGSRADDVFGPLLSSFHISHSVPDDIDLRALVAVVNAETTRIKRRKLYLQTLLPLAIAGFRWRYLSPERRHRFFARHYPVWAGTTPINVTSLWTAAGIDAPPPEYLRGVSTGPLTPMVVAVSIVGEIMDVGVSFRTTAFDRSAVDGVVADILHRIRGLQ